MLEPLIIAVDYYLLYVWIATYHSAGSVPSPFATSRQQIEWQQTTIRWLISHRRIGKANSLALTIRLVANFGISAISIADQEHVMSIVYNIRCADGKDAGLCNCLHVWYLICKQLEAD